MFFLSGMAAPLYQTAWMRQLSVVFRSSELAVATVLTAYMAGLSLAAAITAKYVFRITRPLLTYGLLEAGITISAIFVPTLLLAAGALASHVFGGHASPPQASGFGQMLFYFLSTLVILVIPTALMRATLPLLSKYVAKTNEQVGIRIGGLYAINTFGAVAGNLVAAFVLLPFISLTHTTLIGALINLAVFAIVI
jgi:spermidine synthase